MVYFVGGAVTFIITAEHFNTLYKKYIKDIDIFFPWIKAHSTMQPGYFPLYYFNQHPNHLSIELDKISKLFYSITIWITFIIIILDRFQVNFVFEF